MVKITKEDLDRALDGVNIRHFKLASGDEVIANMNMNSGEMFLEKPLLLNMAPHPYKTTYFFTDWMPLAKEEICVINPSQIISHVECSDDIKERYIRVCLGIKDQASPYGKREYPEDLEEQLELELDEILPDAKTIWH